jgi:excisionase family DNA binding protein
MAKIKIQKREVVPLLLTRRPKIEKGPNHGPFDAFDGASSAVGLPAELPEAWPDPRIPIPRESRRGFGAFPPMPGKRRAPGQRREPGAFLREPEAFIRDSGSRLGAPLSIDQVARLIGCSPWTVRQTLVKKGLPVLRFRSGGRLTFYYEQVVAWIESQQKRGKTK